ncbi:hypothetical protein AFAE65S_00211 [Alcaligenes phenolicus]
MKVYVDMTKCTGFGTCADLAPDVFEIDEFGYALLLHKDSVPKEFEAQAIDASRKCGAWAIRIEDEMFKRPSA